MPIDAGIHERSAANYMQNNRDLLSTLMTTANSYNDRKMKEAILQSPENQAKRLQGEAELAFIRGARGEQLTPDEMNLARIHVANSQKYGFSPTTGAPVALPSALDALLPQQGVSRGTPQASMMQPMDTAGIQPMSAADLQPPSATDALLPKTALPQPPPAGAFQDAMFAGDPSREPVSQPMQRGIAIPQTPAGNPAAAQTAIDETTKANIDIQKAGAKKSAELNAEVMAARPKVDSAYRAALNQANLIDEQINNAKKQVSGWSAGAAKNLAFIGGNDAANLEATLKAIEGDALIGAIEEMRKNSPTGAAIGNPTENEGKSLVASRGAVLAQGQKPQQLYDNLVRYQNIRKSIVNRLREGYKDQYGEYPAGDIGGDSKTPYGGKIKFLGYE